MRWTFNLLASRPQPEPKTPSNIRPVRKPRRFVPALEALENRQLLSLLLRLEETGFAPLTIPGTAGTASFSGPYGTYSTNVVTVQSKPVVGSPSSAELDLTASSENTLGTMGTLTITAADTDFLPPVSPTLLTETNQIQGSLMVFNPSSVIYQSWANANNLSPLPGLPTAIPPGSTTAGPLGPFTVGFYSGTGSASFIGGPGSFSLFCQATITLDAHGILDFFRAKITVPIPTPLGSGETATVGFWKNKNGQALLNSLNGGPTATALGNWLASNFPNQFGALAGQTNAFIASGYSNGSILNSSGQQSQNLELQVLATAFSVYVTNSTLAGGFYAVPYGFTVSSSGTGSSSYNVGNNGAAFGVPNNTSVSILGLLQTVDTKFNSLTGLYYSGDSTLIDMANVVFNGINETGDIH